ncbi:MAG: T9SS type A sorting domain-containing protein [Bacteroidetes bacterium]|nr:T9SS type A sorting domain-containing protein [Bacteroidota bacterium]
MNIRWLSFFSRLNIKQVKNLFIISVFLFNTTLFSQIKFDFININRVLMWTYNSGSGSQHPYTGGNGFYWPYDSSAGIYTTSIFADGLHIGGIINGDTVVKANMYKDIGFQPGNILPNGEPANPADSIFKIWKIRKNWKNLPPCPFRDRLEYDYNNWPIQIGAPWIDVNNDGIYTQGVDSVKFYGDETLFFVYNDFDTTTYLPNWKRRSIGLEIKTIIYGYDSTNFLGDVVFKKYQIINKGNYTINDAIISYWSDDDLGFAGDDYIGGDKNLCLGYTWNSSDSDYVYGNPAPSVGHFVLQSPIISGLPQDSARFNDGWKKGYKNIPISSYNPCFKNNSLLTRDPSNTIQAYNIMNGFKNFGHSYMDPYTDQPTLFPLCGDPESGIGWYEGDGWPAPAPSPFDRRLYINFGRFTIAPQDTQEFVVAIGMARGSSAKNSVTKLKQLTFNVHRFYGNDFITSVDNESLTDLPYKFQLFNNYPNPFNPTTVISWQLPIHSHVTLKIYDILGREVATLVDEVKEAGVHHYPFSIIHFTLSTGVYFYELKAGDFRAVKKMLFIK